MICDKCGKTYSDARTSCPFCGTKSVDKGHLQQKPSDNQSVKYSFLQSVEKNKIANEEQDRAQRLLKEEQAKTQRLLKEEQTREQRLQIEKRRRKEECERISKGIQTQKKWFKFFEIFPIVDAIIDFLAVFIYCAVYSIALGRVESKYYLLIVAGIVGGAIAAIISYVILKGIFSFFILNIYYKEKYFIEKENEDK